MAHDESTRAPQAAAASSPDRPHPPVARKPYSPPTVTRHGRISDVTRSGGATRREGFFVRRRPQ